MTPEQTEIARQLVASPHWRWMPGMEAEYSNGSHRVVETVDAYGHGEGIRLDTGETASPKGAAPNLTDPATIGCLHALACERWGAVGIETRGAIRPEGRLWCTVDGRDRMSAWERVPPVIVAAFPGNPHTAACIAALLHEVTP